MWGRGEPTNRRWSLENFKVRCVKGGLYLNGFSQKLPITSHSHKHSLQFFFQSVHKISSHIGEVTTEIIF